MPTILDIPGAYRFYFYSFDCVERAHVHVRRGGLTCKFCLAPVELARSGHSSARELRTIERVILEHLPKLEEAWDEHCGS